jgi:hypothetical protein
MATTTNYGWTTPDDTALVKDGASAIRTLGTSVDTTTKNLNPETTLGDIAYRSSTSNVNTRLGIGSTGNILTVSGGVPTWAAPAAAGGMTLISTTTLSGATVTLSSIPSTYNHLQLIISGVTGNTSDNQIRILPNNVSNAASASGTRGYPSSSDTQKYVNLPILPNINQFSLRTDADNVVQVTIFNYKSTTQRKSFFCTHRFIGTDSNAYFGISGGFFNSTTDITSLVLDYGGTNTFAGGQVLFYGVS